MKNYRVLLIATLSKPWNNGWYYKTGFEKNGHHVTCFDPQAHKDPSNKVFDVVKETRPDLVLHTKDELPAEVFQKLRASAKVIHWYPDLAFQEWLPPYVKAADIFFTMAEGFVDEYRKLNPHSFFLSQAFEPSFFQIKEITRQDIRKYSTDVAFVGSLGSKEYYLQRRQYLKSIVRQKIKLKWWGPDIPRKISTVPLIIGKIGKAYGGEFVWGEEYAKVARLSKIFLAFDAMPHIRKSMSARMYTAVGCGAFYMCRHVDGIEEMLVPGREIVTFHSENEMVDMIRYYLDNEASRRTIAEAGQKRVLREHTYETRIRQMMGIIEHVIDKT